MDIEYASERIAKDVTRQLKAIAAELKTGEQLHLPDFLDVDPRADYAEWNKKLNQKRAEVKNAPEGAANEQEKLCQTLAKEFKTEKDWRGLLNRLGQMQIEPAIGGLARRKPSPDVVRNAFTTHIHTLEFIVGAPDAEKIVDDLFRERNLVVPDEPETVVKPHHEVTEPVQNLMPVQQEIPPVAPKPEQKPEETGGSFWGRLGGALIEALGEHLDRKVNEVNQRIENERIVASQTPSIGGQWYSPAGGVFTFSQRGSAVSVEGIGSGVPISGRGQIRGKSVQIEGFSPVGGPFQASLVVSPDGNTMTGQLFDSFSRGSPVYLHR